MDLSRCLALCAVAACLAAALAACGERRDTSLESELAAQLTSAVAAKGAAGPAPQVRCEGAKCRARFGRDSEAPLLLVEEADGVRWQLPGALVASRPIEQHLARELAAFGLAVRPACSAPLWHVTAPRREACALGDAGVAWIALGVDGSYQVEVALGAAATERAGGPTAAQLDELSRGFDLLDDGSAEESEEQADGDAPRAATPGAL